MSTYATDPRTSEGITTSPSVQHRARRKVSRQGNSLTVSIPPAFLKTLHLLPGDELELILDHEWGGWFVRPVSLRVFRPAPTLHAVMTGEVAR